MGWAESCYSVLVVYNYRGFSGVIRPPTDCGNPYQFELILMLYVFQVCCSKAVLEITHPVPGQETDHELIAKLIMSVVFY